MTIDEFINKTGFSDRDAWAAKKMYSDEEKSEQEWHSLLKSEFAYGTANLKVDSVEDNAEENQKISKKK